MKAVHSCPVPGALRVPLPRAAAGQQCSRHFGGIIWGRILPSPLGFVQGRENRHCRVWEGSRWMHGGKKGAWGAEGAAWVSGRAGLVGSALGTGREVQAGTFLGEQQSWEGAGSWLIPSTARSGVSRVARANWEALETSWWGQQRAQGRAEAHRGLQVPAQAGGCSPCHPWGRHSRGSWPEAARQRDKSGLRRMQTLTEEAINLINRGDDCPRDAVGSPSPHAGV